MMRQIRSGARRGYTRKTRGQALAEFALVFPILVLLLFGIIDFGWMLFNYSQLYNGLREGLRYGSVSGYDATAQYLQCDTIRNQIMTLAGMSSVQATNITVTYDNGDPNTVKGSCPVGGPAKDTSNVAMTNDSIQLGDRVYIDVNVDVQFLTPFIKAFAKNGMNMHLRAARTIYPNGLG
jgi:Flp pilus assembly protein TadG